MVYQFFVIYYNKSIHISFKGIPLNYVNCSGYIFIIGAIAMLVGTVLLFVKEREQSH